MLLPSASFPRYVILSSRCRPLAALLLLLIYCLIPSERTTPHIARFLQPGRQEEVRQRPVLQRRSLLKHGKLLIVGVHADGIQVRPRHKLLSRQKPSVVVRTPKAVTCSRRFGVHSAMYFSR